VSEPGLRGALVWAIVPYVPEAPFRLWLGRDQPDAEIPDARTFSEQVRKQGLDAEQSFIVKGKLRPVLLLLDRPRGVLREIVALRMVRLEALDDDAQARIRQQLEPSLFHLPVREEKYGLSKEVAIDLNALVRVHASAFLPKAVGRLDDNEMRVIGERLAEHLDIDLEPLIAMRVEERLEALTRPSGQSRP
jgi:mRNA-degrading endonuclease toxin of MazEF toxin-antitoxin module